MPLSRADFTRFLASTAKPDRACSHCGRTAYLINVVGGQIPAEIRVPESAVQPHVYYSASCAYCGRTDIFHTNQIQQWLQEHPGIAS